MAQPQLRPTKITWNDKTPPELKSSLQPIVDELIWLLPRWCEELIIEFEVKPDENYTAACMNSEEYRWIKIFVSPYWLQYSSNERKYELIHEFIHASNGYLSNFTKRLLSRYVKDEDARSLLTTEWQNYLERSTQDLACCIYAKTYDSLPPSHIKKPEQTGKSHQ